MFGKVINMPDTEILKIWVNVILLATTDIKKLIFNNSYDVHILCSNIQTCVAHNNLQILPANKVLHPMNIQSIIAVSCFGIWYICIYAADY